VIGYVLLLGLFTYMLCLCTWCVRLYCILCAVTGCTLSVVYSVALLLCCGSLPLEFVYLAEILWGLG
jgi:hypothetical protein